MCLGFTSPLELGSLGFLHLWGWKTNVSSLWDDVFAAVPSAFLRLNIYVKIIIENMYDTEQLWPHQPRACCSQFMVQEDHRLSGRGAARQLGRESRNDPDKLDATWREGHCGGIRGGANKKNKSCFPLSSLVFYYRSACQIPKLPRRPSSEPRICHRWQSCWQVMPSTEAPGIWMNHKRRQPSQEPDPDASDILSHPPRGNRQPSFPRLDVGKVWSFDVQMSSVHWMLVSSW